MTKEAYLGISQKLVDEAFGDIVAGQSVSREPEDEMPREFVVRRGVEFHDIFLRHVYCPLPPVCAST